MRSCQRFEPSFLYLTVFLFLILVGSNSAQQKEISSKQKELNKLKIEIESLQKEIHTNEIKEKKNYELIEKYNQQTFLLNKLINSVKSEVTLKNKAITGLEQNVYALEKNIKELKSTYAKYIVSIYKGTFANKLSYILNASSIQQAILRYKYLSKISEQRERDIIRITENKLRLSGQKDLLENEKREKTQLIGQKEREEKQLVANISQKKKIISKIKNDKESLKKELDAKKRAEQQIRNMIAKLIEESLSRKKSKNSAPNKENTNSANEDLPQYFDITTKFSSFENLRGRMSWPVNKGTILRDFGENLNEKLNTVTINYGIDIKASGDLNVRAVAEGVVSVINWLPGYGSVVILTHKNEFRSVYGHISDIYVTEGEVVTPGKVIGRIGESLEGNILHFEIWNQRVNQNPTIWLARR
ncbi:MAG: murein hydrolase activator EnvC [Ignavibacteriaceae bacterium]